jgi:hypothetical protein
MWNFNYNELQGAEFLRNDARKESDTKIDNDDDHGWRNMLHSTVNDLSMYIKQT